MLDKTIKRIRYIFICSIILSISTFVTVVLYVHKHVPPQENTALERWSIIFTMAGIVAALKFLHPKLDESDRTNLQTAIKKFTAQYHLRLISLLVIFILNISCLYITGIKNFMFLAFITIFALFLCAPSKKHIEPNVTDENL